MTTTDISVCHGTDPSLRLEEVHRPGGSKVLPWLTQPAPTGNPGENHGKLGLVSGKNHGKLMVFFRKNHGKPMVLSMFFFDFSKEMDGKPLVSLCLSPQRSEFP